MLKKSNFRGTYLWEMVIYSKMNVLHVTTKRILDKNEEKAKKKIPVRTRASSLRETMKFFRAKVTQNQI
jgi:hypothetical protein